MHKQVEVFLALEFNLELEAILYQVQRQMQEQGSPVYHHLLSQCSESQSSTANKAWRTSCLTKGTT